MTDADKIPDVEDTVTVTIEDNAEANEAPQFVPNAQNFREDMNLTREMKSIHVFFDHVDKLQDKLICTSLKICASCTIKIQVNGLQERDGWAHLHFDSINDAVQMEVDLKLAFPEGRVHSGEFIPQDKDKASARSDGSRPLERTLCLYNVPKDACEAEVKEVLPDDIRITVVVDTHNVFKGYVYLHYKLSDDATKALQEFKTCPIKIREQICKVTKLSTDEAKKDKKRNQMPKKGRKGGPICPERQALSTSLDALKRQHQTTTQPLERQKLKQKIGTLKSMLAVYNNSTPSRNKQAKYSHYDMYAGGIHRQAWGPAPVRHPCNGAMFGMQSPQDGPHIPYDQHMFNQSAMMDGNAGRAPMNNSKGLNKGGYVSRGKAGYAILNPKQQKQQKKQELHYPPHENMMSMLESFQQMSMQSQQPNYNDPKYNGYNFKEYSGGYAGDYKATSYNNGFSNGYSDDYWDTNHMSNANMMSTGQRKPAPLMQLNNWGVGHQRPNRPRNSMGAPNHNYQSYM